MKNALVFVAILLLVSVGLSAQPVYHSRISLVADGVMGTSAANPQWEMTPSCQFNIATNEKDFNVYGTARSHGNLQMQYAFGAGVAFSLWDGFQLSAGGLYDENRKVRFQVGTGWVMGDVTLDVVADHNFSSSELVKSHIANFWYDARLMFHSKTGAHKMAIGLMARAQDGVGGRAEIELLGGLYLTAHGLWDFYAPDQYRLKMGAGLTLRY